MTTPGTVKPVSVADMGVDDQFGVAESTTVQERFGHVAVLGDKLVSVALLDAVDQRVLVEPYVDQASTAAGRTGQQRRRRTCPFATLVNGRPFGTTSAMTEPASADKQIAETSNASAANLNTRDDICAVQ